MTSDDLGLAQSPAQAVEGDKTRWMDRKDDLSNAIEASHPLNTGRHDLYQRAMELVGNRHSKGGLVCLVNHLLAEADSLRNALSAEGSATIAAARKQAAEEMRERAANTAELIGQSYESAWMWDRKADPCLQGCADTADEVATAIRALPPSSSPEDQQKATATPTIADPDGEARS